jgi:Ring finger domain/IBR domain, a half RING-finger domain
MPSKRISKGNLNPLESCKICCEESKLATTTFSQCGHKTCPDCITQWIRKAENSGQATLPGCPFCRSLLSKEDIVGILGRPYEPTEKPAIVSNLDDLDELTRQYLASRAKPCPGCGAYIEKTEGCDKMECLCGYRFCFNCGAQNADCLCTPSHHHFWRNATLPNLNPVEWQAHFPWLAAQIPTTATAMRPTTAPDYNDGLMICDWRRDDPSYDSPSWTSSEEGSSPLPEEEEDFNEPYPNFDEEICLFSDSSDNGSERYRYSEPSISSVAIEENDQDSLSSGASVASSLVFEVDPNRLSDAENDFNLDVRQRQRLSLDVRQRQRHRNVRFYGSDDHDEDLLPLLFQDPSVSSTRSVSYEGNTRSSRDREQDRLLPEEVSGCTAQDTVAKGTRHRGLKIVKRKVAMVRTRVISFVKRIRQKRTRG